MINAPLLLFLLTGGFAFLAAFLRRKDGALTLISSGGALLLAIFVTLISFEEPVRVLGIPLKLGDTWRVLGRSFVLDETNRTMVGFLYFIGAFIFPAARSANTNRYFNAVGLLSLGAVAASLLITPFLFAAIFIEFTAIGAILLLAAPEYGAWKGSLRLLTLYTIGMLAILLAGWMLDTIGVTTATPDLAQRTITLLAVGFAVLMAVPPFHHWLTVAAGKTNPFALTFVTVVLQSVGLFLMLRFLDGHTWMREEPRFFTGMRWAGIFMIVYGGFSALAQRSFSRVMAYALLTDFGVTLIAVSAHEADGYRLALGLMGVRVVGMAVWALGLVKLVDNYEQDQPEYLQGAANRGLLPATAALIGVLCIAGFPLTAGFPARWALITSLGSIDLIAGGAVLFSTFCISASAIVWLHHFLQPTEDRPQSVTPEETLFFIGGIGLILAFGVFPQLVYPWIVEMASGLTNLLP
jgi:formate hydrogenlyase subunit 3/multisubunit Na+/H+ antiporter MnhD subunit